MCGKELLKNMLICKSEIKSYFPLLKLSRTIRRASIENSAKSIYECGFRAPGMLINCWLENEQCLVNITYINPVTHQFHSERFLQENENKCP